MSISLDQVTKRFGVTFGIEDVTAELPSGSLTAILVRACALSLGEHPRANGSYRDGQFELYSRVNVGIVVASEVLSFW